MRNTPSPYNRLPRRDFLKQTAAQVLTGTAVAGILQSQHGLQAGEDSKAKSKPAAAYQLGAFTKSFQDMPIPDVCRAFQSIGLDGLDLTVRPKGHILPENAEQELPQACAAAKEAGVKILFLTTMIDEPDKNAERILATAREQGIDRVKIGYYRYKTFGTLAQQLKETTKKIGKVAKLCQKYEVLPCVHVHSNAFIPSHGTQLYQLIQDYSPQEIGAYVDTLHMVKEGSGDGWRQGLDLLGPWIALCAVKNFAWERGDGRDKYGHQKWEAKTVPVADGISPIPQFVDALRKLGYKGTFSLHSEFKGRHSWKELSTQECLAQTAVDAKYFRSLWQ
ncbi:Xylose isomerase-like TIM barrel [Gimesia maris]|uniref:sugar phosphate isomerase/epimerase family protein n=1 Tax=Gimesia maris TaxID=122 RepID=UPI00118ABA32|nr:TIM barrel protein [Gimesia maris]QDT82043.1 Xylose isomerase-like TIM barrel [Gimesia maris]